MEERITALEKTAHETNEHLTMLLGLAYRQVELTRGIQQALAEMKVDLADTQIDVASIKHRFEALDQKIDQRFDQLLALLTPKPE